MIKAKLFPIMMVKPNYSGIDIQRGNRGELGNILELKTGYTCNNQCIHCPNIEKKKIRNRSTADCQKILGENRIERNLLIISGGEPTIRDDFQELIIYARDLDYQWIQVKTNGRMFSDANFAKRIVSLIQKHPLSGEERSMDHPRGYSFRGLDIIEFYIPLFAHNSTLHDYITQVPGSFQETLRGMKNLLDLNQAVAVNVVITKLNFNYLPDIIRFLDDYSLKYVELSFVEPEGGALADFKNICPEFSSTQSFPPRLPLSAFRQNKFKKLYIINSIPLCQKRGIPVKRSEWFYPYDRHFMYKLADIEDTATYYQVKTRKNAKNNDCRFCIFDPICYGLNKNYSERMGFGSIKPVLGNPRMLVETEEAKRLENPRETKISDLRFEFSDPKIKVDFGQIKADAVAMISGGVDSALAAAIYARENKDKKIVLVTFYEFYSPGADVARVAAYKLIKKHKNILKHFIIPIPFILSKKIIFEDLEKQYKYLNYYPTCTCCALLRLSYGIYLLKKYFGGNIIIAGNRKGEIRRIRDKESEFLKDYSIEKIYPLYDFTKERTVEMARAEGLPVTDLHSQCWLDDFKSRLRNHDAKKTEHIFKQIKEKFHQLLEGNGVFKDNELKQDL